MKVISLNDMKKIPVTMDGAAGVCKQLPLAAADGSPVFSFRVFTIEPGGHTPYHTHAFEHLNYVIEGAGTLVQENGDKVALKKGDFALVLPHEKHQYRNSSVNEPFVMICAVPREYEQLNRERRLPEDKPLPVKARGKDGAGRSYRFFDLTAFAAKRFYYRLECIDASGVSLMHGPVHRDQ